MKRAAFGGAGPGFTCIGNRSNDWSSLKLLKAAHCRGANSAILAPSGRCLGGLGKDHSPFLEQPLLS